ncbi:MAG: SdrD B-like domain-containing protein, partial [Actinomycetota bacterium]
PVSADLGNRIWFDLDADGEQDAGEPGISGVTVTASWIDPADGVTVITRTQITDDEGEYGFDDLPRNVEISVTVDAGTLPGGVTQTFELGDDPDLTDTQQNNREGGALDGEVADIELDATTPSYPDVDFGYVGTGAIGDTVWLDLDDDGVLDADEVGIPGVTVTVVWGGPDGIVGTDDDVTFTDVTDADGEYLVDGLPGGEYEVSIDPATLPDGVVPTHDLDGGDDRTTEVTLGDGETRLDVDFGERPEADLAIDKSSSGEFAVGSQNTWTITVTNNGPAVTSGTVTVTDELPDGTTFVRGDTTDWACAASGQTVTCELIGSLAVNASSIIPVIVEVANEVGGDSLTNSASIEDVGGHVDPVPENDEDDDTVDVPLSILGIDKALVEDELVSDGTATWRITVTNYGPSATTGTVTVVDDLPTTLGFVRGESTDFACSASGQTVTCNADTVMAVGDEIVVDIVTVVNAEPGVSITNSAGVFGGTTVSGDPLPEDVLDDIRDELEDGLDDALDVSVPTDVGGDAETPPSPALAFTGSDSDRLLGLAFALVALGVAFMALARRRKPVLATTN